MKTLKLIISVVLFCFDAFVIASDNTREPKKFYIMQVHVGGRLVRTFVQRVYRAPTLADVPSVVPQVEHELSMHSNVESVEEDRVVPRGVGMRFSDLTDIEKQYRILLDNISAQRNAMRDKRKHLGDKQRLSQENPENSTYKLDVLEAQRALEGCTTRLFDLLAQESALRRQISH